MPYSVPDAVLTPADVGSVVVTVVVEEPSEEHKRGSI